MPEGQAHDACPRHGRRDPEVVAGQLQVVATAADAAGVPAQQHGLVEAVAPVETREHDRPDGLAERREALLGYGLARFLDRVRPDLLPAPSPARARRPAAAPTVLP